MGIGVGIGGIIGGSPDGFLAGLKGEPPKGYSSEGSINEGLL